MGKKANLSPFNLGGVFEGDNEAENNVTFLGSHFTGNILFYGNVDPAKVRRLHYEDIMQFLNNPYQIYLDCYMKGYIVPVSFWQELAPLLCRPDMQRLPYDTQMVGWLERALCNDTEEKTEYKKFVEEVEFPKLVSYVLALHRDVETDM
ncbi:hypothetical protein Tco_0324703 [Tanacetum coccineum]